MLRWNTALLGLLICVMVALGQSPIPITKLPHEYTGMLENFLAPLDELSELLNETASLIPK